MDMISSVLSNLAQSNVNICPSLCVSLISAVQKLIVKYLDQLFESFARATRLPNVLGMIPLRCRLISTHLENAAIQSAQNLAILMAVVVMSITFLICGSMFSGYSSWLTHPKDEQMSLSCHFILNATRQVQIEFFCRDNVPISTRLLMELICMALFEGPLEHAREVTFQFPN